MSGLSVAFLFLYRLAVPLVLLAASVLRVNGISLAYLIILLAWAALPINSRRPRAGVVVAVFGLVLSIVGLLGQALFQIVLATDYKDDIQPPCTSTQRVWQQIGFNLMNHFHYQDYLHYLLPDVVVLVICVVVLILGIKAIRQQSDEHSRGASGGEQSGRQSQHSPGFIQNMITVHSIIFFLSLFLAAVIKPSILTGIYLLLLLAIGLVWSTYHSFPVILHWTKLLTIIYSGLHLFALYIYQLYAFQHKFSPDNKWIKFLGLSAIYDALDCLNQRPWEYSLGSDLNWRDYCNPGAILVLYVVSCYEVHLSQLIPNDSDRNKDDNTQTDLESWWLNPKSRRHSVDPKSTSEDESSETIELLSGGSPRVYSSLEPVPTKTTEESAASDGKKQRNSEKTQKSSSSNVYSFSSALYEVVMDNSWHVTVIVMIAWSIIFVSWMTFALLVWASIIWISCRSRTLCLYTATVLVLYAMALVIGQYVYSLEGINDEIDNEEQVGFTSKWNNQLPIQIVFLWAFWINQRQFFREHKQKRSFNARKKSTFESIRQQLMPTPDSPEKDALVRALEWTVMFVNEYWVLLCYAVFLLVSLTVEVSIMRYVYMAFFLLLLGFYQLSKSFYRVIITRIWWVVAIYSVLFVWMLYLFQLDAVYDKLTDLAYSENETNKTLLSDIGLKQFSSGKLLENLLAPTLALIIIMLQLKYFHRKSKDPQQTEALSEEGLRPSAERQAAPDIERASPITIQRSADEATVDLSFEAAAATELTDDGTKPSKEDEKSQLTHKNLRWLFWSGLGHFIVAMSGVVLRLVELYLPTGLLLCILIVALQQISAIEVFPVIALCVFIVTWRGQKLFYFLIMLWTSLTITAKMLYQLQLIKPYKEHYNCSYKGQYKVKDGLELGEWFGLKKLDDTSIASYIAGYIVIVVLIALVISANRYQRDRAQKNVKLPEKYALFLRVTRVDADLKLISAAKYLINHFFEIFGIQMCFVAFGIVAAVRLDAYGLLYCLILAVLLLVSETGRRRLWPVVVIIVAVCLSMQYVLLVGAPPTTCYFLKHDYPWFSPIVNKTGLFGWFYLPVFKGISWKQEDLLRSYKSEKDYLKPQDEWFLVGDFFLLVLLGCQWSVYQWLETRRSTVKAASQNPVEIYTPPDFTFPDPKGPWQKLWLDYLKILIFKYGFWFTLLMVFLTGVNRISLFCFGYIVFAFIFLWFGQRQLTFTKEWLSKWWNALLGYNVFVIVFKVALQLGACAYSGHLPCGMVKLFNIVCIHQHQYENNLHVEIKVCKSGGIPDTTGIALDVVAFGFILIQRYLFSTQYFVHVQNEMLWYSSNLTLGASMVKQATRYSRRKLKKVDEERQKEIQEHVDKLRQDHHMHQFLYAGTKPVEGILEPTEASLSPERDVDPTLAAEIDKEAESLESESAFPKETDVDQSSDLSTLQKIKLGLLEILDELTVWLQHISSSYRAVSLTLEDMRRKRKEADRRHDLQDTPLHELDEHVDEPIFKAGENPESLIDKFLLSDESPDDAERARVLQEKLKKGLASITLHFRRLFKALYYAIVARTDLICYFVIIINFMVTGSALSLPLPFMVFFWGLLSVPRPSKTFWIVLESYVMFIIVVRYICQSTLIPLRNADSGEEDENLRWPAYIGIQQVNDFMSRSMADFVVLWAVCIHIAKLQLRGLWLSTREQTAIDGHRELSPVEEEEAYLDDHEDDEDDDDDNGNGDNIVADNSPSVSKPPTKPNLCKRLFRTVYRFFKRAISRKHSPGWKDYYTLMVFFDVLSFIITIFGWSYFGEANDANVASYIQQNYIPVPFIAMLIVQFILILVDRLLYRRGWELGKLIMLVGVVIVVHIWVFLGLPLATRRSFVGNSVVQTWYFFKSVYMGLSAAQVAAGYPPRRSGNFLMDTKKYPTVRGRVFQVLFLVPFFTELRELMDWCVSSTTLDLILWLKVQDVWYEMFLVKCRRKREERNPRTLGDKQPPITKFILGSVLILVLVIVLWFPLLWISLLNSSSVPNRPVEVSVELKVGGFEPLFSFTAQEQSLQALTSSQYSFLKSEFNTQGQKNVFVRYDAEDITRTLIPSTSSSQWIISPVARDLLAKTLENESIPIVNMDFRWTLTRNPPTGFVSQVVSGNRNMQLHPRDHVRNIISIMLRNDSELVRNHSIPNLFPVFISAPANDISEQMAEFAIPNEKDALANCSLFLQSNKSDYGDIEWWKLNQTSPHVIHIPGDQEGYLEFIIFSEKVTPPAFSFLAGSSVIGLYISIVLVIGQFLKGFTKDISHKIIYQDVPEPADVIRLCEDIFLVRELGKEGLQLEELLVGKLFFLYRSPERMIEWTRIRRDTDHE